MSLNKKVIDKLKTVIDPEVRVDVYSLKLVYDIIINEEEKSVSLKFKPTVYQCPLGIQLSLSVKRALLEIDELEKVNVEVTDYILMDKANSYLSALDK
ncbi:MAG: iron-sulfur cluster assembly protein [Acidobacteriota bacterium]